MGTKFKIVVKIDDDRYRVYKKCCNDIYDAIDWIKSQGHSVYDIEEIIKY